MTLNSLLTTQERVKLHALQHLLICNVGDLSYRSIRILATVLYSSPNDAPKLVERFEQAYL